ncbi:MAG: class I SAM-dependent methyltransferase [Vicinamibacterales bacterium]
MAVTHERPRVDETARAFDQVAHEYDRTNRANPILEDMRRRSLAMLRRYVPAGAELLDIGCGPGTDQAALVAAGYCLTAIDPSPAMVHQARRTAERRAAAHGPTVLCRSVDQVGKFQPASFDAAFSNFGPLNCVDDLAAVARQLHDVLRPGGVLVASVIGRICPWELALYLSRGDLRRATLRFRRGQVPVPLKHETVWTTYLTPAACTRAFGAAGFTRRECVALGVAAPPPYMEAFAARRPGVVSRLLRVDEAIGHWPVVRAMGDHFLIVLQRG